MIGQVTFVVKGLPSNTPEKDSLFVCGNFNNWNIHDLNYRLLPQPNGYYSITINCDSDKIEYKFSRGSWMKIETSADNNYLPNRIYKKGETPLQEINIKTWQDQGGDRGFNFYILLLFTEIMFALFLFFIVFRIKKRNRNKVISFITFNGILITLLLSGLVYTQVDLIIRSHLSSIGLICIFFWNQLLMSHTCSIRSISNNIKWLQCFFPALAFIVLAALQWINIHPFSTAMPNSLLTWGRFLQLLMGSFCFIIGHLPLIKSQIIYHTNKIKKTETEQFAHIIELISIVALAYFIIQFLVDIFNIHIVIFQGFEPLIILLSFVIFVELFYYWKHPELMRDKNIALPITDLMAIKEKLERIMKTEKPFTNPELSLNDLSEILEIKIHVLSKVFNEHYSKNFRDFINEYRVNEFISLSRQECYKNYTFLALALKVGFNSKSTFNLAFKKVTNLSPREFLKKNKQGVTKTLV